MVPQKNCFPFQWTLLFLFFGFLQWPGEPVRAQEPERYRVMFYNVENLFDTLDAPSVDDAEFLPDSDRHWDTGKYYEKLNHIYKVIISCGEWDPPAMAGLCEVENREVLESLVRTTPLKKFGYRVIHFDSPDNRGIDAALIYRESHFSPDTAYPIPVSFPFAPDSKTRDILYVKGRIGGRQTLHVFVNHWPSRYGGYQETIPKRNQAARVLRTAVDSIRSADPGAFILAMGDFNDGPFEQSMTLHLGASADTAGLDAADLFNLTGRYAGTRGTGTLKYRENWDVFDQLIISPNLLDAGAALFVSPEGARIHQPEFLLEPDDRYLGKKPFRTYAGMKYLGGYSDHLPVFVDLKLQ